MFAKMYKFKFENVKKDIIKMQQELHGYNWDDYMEMDIYKFIDIRNTLIEVQRDNLKDK